MDAAYWTSAGFAPLSTSVFVEVIDHALRRVLNGCPATGRSCQRRNRSPTATDTCPLEGRLAEHVRPGGPVSREETLWSFLSRSCRLILRKERPHPGAQLTFSDVDGMRITAFLTDTAPRLVPGQVAGLELRHRQHARVEDRIRETKATGLRNLPCRGWDENAAWLEVVLTAVDLVCWTKTICFADTPTLARCEIATFRYRILQVAAGLTRTARQLHLRIAKTRRWAAVIAEGFDRLRAAFT